MVAAAGQHFTSRPAGRGNRTRRRRRARHEKEQDPVEALLGQQALLALLLPAEEEAADSGAQVPVAVGARGGEHEGAKLPKALVGALLFWDEFVGCQEGVLSCDVRRCDATSVHSRKRMVARACLVEAAVEVEIHSAPHDPGDVGALRPARAEVVEGLGDEGLMCVGGKVLSHHDCTLDSNRSYLAVRRTSVSVTPAWAPPVREVCAEAEAASASRLLLEEKDGRTLTPAEAATAAAASSCSRSLCVESVCTYVLMLSARSTK